MSEWNLDPAAPHWLSFFFLFLPVLLPPPAVGHLWSVTSFTKSHSSCLSVSFWLLQRKPLFQITIAALSPLSHSSSQIVPLSLNFLQITSLSLVLLILLYFFPDLKSIYHFLGCCFKTSCYSGNHTLLFAVHKKGVST